MDSISVEERKLHVKEHGRTSRLSSPMISGTAHAVGQAGVSILKAVSKKTPSCHNKQGSLADVVSDQFVEFSLRDLPSKFQDVIQKAVEKKKMVLDEEIYKLVFFEEIHDGMERLALINKDRNAHNKRSYEILKHVGHLIEQTKDINTKSA